MDNRIRPKYKATWFRSFILGFILLFVIGCDNNDTASLYKKYLIPKNEGFKSISLPFSSKEYIENIRERDNAYPFYTPSDFLIKYFVSIDYEGEEYKCYILPQKGKELILLAYIPGGDSEYYLLMLLNSEKVITYREIGKGGDDFYSFTIKEDFSIDTYNDDGDLGKFLIKGDSIIVENEPVQSAQASIAANQEDSKPTNANCGSGGKRFVEENDSKKAKCEKSQGEESETQECAFPDVNLRQVYDIVKKLHPDLKDALPAEDSEYSCQESEISSRRITYKHKSPKHLLISIEYIDGGDVLGEDEITIIENENDTKTKMYFRG